MGQQITLYAIHMERWHSSRSLLEAILPGLGDGDPNSVGDLVMTLDILALHCLSTGGPQRNYEKTLETVGIKELGATCITEHSYHFVDLLIRKCSEFDDWFEDAYFLCPSPLMTPFLKSLSKNEILSPYFPKVSTRQADAYLVFNSH